MLDALRCAAQAQARARFWELSGTPQRLTIDVDATLIAAQSGGFMPARRLQHSSTPLRPRGGSDEYRNHN